MKSIQIFTDGACSGNPGPGGWGSILEYQQVAKEISGFESQTTNNRMELTAAIEALNALKEPCEVELYTDSAYLCNAFKQGWIENWQRNGWQTSAKKAVENRDLWEKLVRLARIHNVVWNKVKGHSDHEKNNRCDELARMQIKSNILKAPKSIEKQ